MSLSTLLRTTFLTAVLSFAVSKTSFATAAQTTKTTTKTEAKKSKLKSVAKEKKSAAPAKAKTKAEKKVSGKAETKTKAKEKNTATKKLSAKAPKKLATADTFESEESSVSFSTIFFYGFILLAISALCFAVWLDYRPTVYASGKVYGPLEYLQSPFTTEINGTTKQKPSMREKPVDADKVNQPVPVTVTREPVNKSVKNPTAKAG